MSSDTEKRPRSEKQLAHDKKFGGKLDPSIQQRNRLGKAFISRMRADFQKHGIATIEKVRKEKPEVYLNLVSRLVPQQLEVNVQHSFTDVLMEAARRYEQAREIKPAINADISSVIDADSAEIIEATYTEEKIDG